MPEGLDEEWQQPCDGGDKEVVKQNEDNEDDDEEERAKKVEICFDLNKYRESLKESRRKHTVRVKSQLP